MKKLVILTIFASLTAVSALSVGEKVSSVTVRDSNDAPSQIPGLGEKVITVFYTDPDVSDQNDLFADMLKAEKLSKSLHKGVGIGNLQDSWKPDGLIRAVIRRKEKKYDSKILTDPSGILRSEWNLGSCNEKSVVIVIGKDKKVHFIKKGHLSKQESVKVISLIKSLMK